MKVLLLCNDLFLNIGGGQTIYRTIIESTPDVDFYYYRRREDEINPLRPANAHVLSIQHDSGIGVKSDPLAPVHYIGAINQLNLYAKGAAGQSFDVVESPDFEVFGGFIREVFEYHGIRFGRSVLSLHGNISTSIKLNWNKGQTLSLEDLEFRQFSRADGVYGISPAYIDRWRQKFERPVEFIDPLYFVNRTPAVPVPNPRTPGRPGLYCIGRLEKLKGPDIFLELARWLPSDLYSDPFIVGGNEWVSPTAVASDILYGCAAHRGWEHLNYLGQMQPGQLMKLFSDRNMIVLPVRADSLNLVALEALFSGCPVAISSRAGVCAYLDQYWPNLPYVKIDFNNLYGCVESLAEVLRNYDQCRAELKGHLDENPVNLPPLKMGEIYQKFLDSPLPPKAADIYELSPKLSLRYMAKAAAKKIIPQAARPHLRRARNMARTGRAKFIETCDSFIRKGRRKKYAYIGALTKFRHTAKYISNQIENSKQDLSNKLSCIYSAAEASPLLRVWYWKEIARLEDIRKKDVFSAVYKLRIMRALGRDRFDSLASCLRSLKESGYPEVARAAQAMYAPGVDSVGAVYDYLKSCRERNLAKPDQPYELLDDRREPGQPKVSVIVSLYNAAPKLKFFLTALANQTLVKKGLVEFIIQDSASQLPEKEALDAFLSETPLSLVYGRSGQRETIQGAWNRGIKMARAPYLVFLGVDEGLYPEALETLADELDRHPEADWVMSSSQVTKVDPNGVLDCDIMTYRRGGATKDHNYMDTCYVSWVGGMYRKSLHDRCGFYDESFRGAGDTEFKNRILPDIQVRFLSQTLGIFFDYPEERTTATPMAEIEDCRAWYIHRTLGGVRYAFENRPLSDVRIQLLRTLGYRKSYCGHLSTDFDYGAALAEYGYEREGGQWWSAMLTDLKTLREMLRALEYGVKPGILPVRRYISLFKQAAALEQKHRSMFGGEAQPSYNLFNDNRYEQHSWLWKSSDQEEN